MSNIIQEMGIKTLEHVTLRAIEDDVFGRREVEKGEPILFFEEIQIAQLTENAKLVAARGGFMNQPRIVWEDRQNTIFSFQNGTLNQVSLNLLLEGDLLDKDGGQLIPFAQKIETDDSGIAALAYEPVILPDHKMFVFFYAADNIQAKVPAADYQISVDNNGNVKIIFNSEKPQYANTIFMVEYYFEEQTELRNYTLAKERVNNTYFLEATFQLKDENTGTLHTGLLEMPKVKVLSNINLRLGERADPTVGTFNVVAMPDSSEDYDAIICKVTYIDRDIYEY